MVGAIAAVVVGCAGGIQGDAEDVQYAPVFCVQKSPGGGDALGRLSFASGVEGWAAAFDPPGPTVAHWLGGRWRLMHLPKPAGKVSTVYAVSGLGDAWAVGAIYPTGTTDRSTPLIEHWAGGRWRIVPSPHLNAQAVVLKAVVEISLRDVWAVGGYGNRAGAAFPLRMLAEHWNGRRWRVVPMPRTVGSENGLEALTWASPRSLWTVATLDKRPGSSRALERPSLERPAHPAPARRDGLQRGGRD